MWQFLNSIRRREGRCPKGLLPFEDVLDYGKRSLIVVSPWLGHNVRKIQYSEYLHNTLRTMEQSFSALDCAHERGISINYWPSLTGQKALTSFHSAFYSRAFVFDKEDVPTYKHQGLGQMAATRDPRFAEIVGRTFSNQTIWAIPCSDEAPDVALDSVNVPTLDPHNPTARERIRSPWSPGTAAEALYSPAPPIVSVCSAPELRAVRPQNCVKDVADDLACGSI